MDAILRAVWEFFNSPVGIALVAGVVLWLLNRLYAAKPGWQKYEGATDEEKTLLRSLMSLCRLRTRSRFTSTNSIRTPG